MTYIQRKNMTVNRSRRFKNTFSSQLNGALGEGDRGAWQDIPEMTGNPYENPNYVYRWRQYCHLYEICWEARKIVRIPVEDALRKPVEVDKIPEEMKDKIRKKLQAVNFQKILSRSLMLERLLGGCLTLFGLESGADDPKVPFDPRKEKSSLKFLNAIPISRITRMSWDTNPFSEYYMRPHEYVINGETLHVSRCLVWDGEPIFDPYDFALTNFRANLAGFGPSKLTPIWDDIIKAKGTRQAAYQLIQTNNSIIMAVNALQDLQGSKPGKATLAELKRIANSLSVYRAALVEKEKVEITQNAASFGSVPELIITFIQVLSAASDIPATRFLGQAPGGLNATGESDLENYYNMINAFQTQRLEPAYRRIYDIVGYNLFPNEWDRAREDLEFTFPPLWNLSEKEEAETKGLQLDNLIKAYEQGSISDDKFIEEMNAQKIFSIELDESDKQMMETLRQEREMEGVVPQGEGPVPNAQESIQKMRNSYYYRFMNSNPRLIGEALGIDWNEIPYEEFEAGMKVELEHKDITQSDPILTGKIALAHLKEDPHYYTKLKTYVENMYVPFDGVDLNPTPGRQHAGNYRKFHTKLHGLNIAIENPKGSERHGIDAQGNSWSSILPAHYGYIKRTEGADGDHLDVFVGPHEDSDQVFVVDQKDKDTGTFDEHKAIFGALSMTQAKQLYLDAFADGQGNARLMSITPLTVDKFKQWLKDGDLKKPYHEFEKKK